MRNKQAKFFHLRQSIEYGRKIQRLIDKEIINKGIVESFRNGSSGAALVREFRLNSILRISKGTAKRSVLSALKGYDGSHNFGDAYEGLVAMDEYLEIVEEHRKKQAADSLKKARIANGGTSTKEIIFLSEKEVCFIEDCLGKAKYQNRGTNSPTKIAKSLNKKFKNRNVSMHAVFAVMKRLKLKNTVKRPAA